MFRLRSTEKKTIRPNAKSPTVAIWTKLAENASITSRLAAPPIVSTKNQRKMPTAKAARCFAFKTFPVKTIMNSPTKAGMRVAAVHVRKLSRNPIKASLRNSHMKLKGLWLNSRTFKMLNASTGHQVKSNLVRQHWGRFDSHYSCRSLISTADYCRSRLHKET